MALAALLSVLLPAAHVRAGGENAAQDSLPRSQPVLRVATSGDYAPFSWDASAGDAGIAAPGASSSAAPASSAPPPRTPAPMLTGFDIEVATQFAREHGYQLELVRFRWPDLGRELATGNFDVAMSGVTLKPERSVAGRFTVPVARTHAVALTWKGSGATTMAELDVPVRRIAVNAGGHLESVAREAFRRAEVVAIADNEAVRMALLDRAFDAVVTDSFEQKVWTEGVRDVVEIGPLSDDRKGYLLPADRGPLAAQLDRWLLAREKDGTLAGLRSRHFATTSGAPTGGETFAAAEPLAALATAVVERLALMPLVYEAKQREGKATEDKAQEAAVLDGAVQALAEAATAAGAAPPDMVAARSLFEVLIEMGKDAQQSQAGSEARRRPGAVRHRPKQPEATPTSDAVAAAAEPDGRPARPKAASRTYDLATELRPAIGRIGEKIARILVAMEPVGVTQANRVLGHSLVPQNVKAERIDALATAVATFSSRRAAPK